MHYSKATMAWYRANEVKFVPKYMNPQNCPEAKPIETFWALTKTYLRKNFKAAESIKKFGKDWRKASKMVATNLCRTS